MRFRANKLKADLPVDLVEKLNQIAANTRKLSEEPEQTTFEAATGTTLHSPSPEDYTEAIQEE